MQKTLTKAQFGASPLESAQTQTGMGNTILDSLFELIMRGVTGESSAAQTQQPAAQQPVQGDPSLDLAALLSGQQEQGLTQVDELSALLSLMDMFQSSGGTPGQPGQAQLRDIPAFLQQGPSPIATWDPQGMGYPGNVMGYNTAAMQANAEAENQANANIIDFLIGTQYQTPGTSPQPADPNASAQSAKDLLDRFLGRPTDAQRVSQAQSTAQSAGQDIRGLMDTIMNIIASAGQPATAAAPQFSGGLGGAFSGASEPNYQMGGFPHAAR